MKRGLELNGVANIHMLLDLEADESNDGRVAMNVETLVSIKTQLDLLERYMLAREEAVKNNTDAPFWHEVRENPKNYPTNRERHTG